MKTSVFIAASLDGFIAREDGSIDWLVKFESPDVFAGYNEFISRIDAIVIGRGIPLFDTLGHDLPFKHLETKVYPNGLVRSRYERKRD